MTLTSRALFAVLLTAAFVLSGCGSYSDDRGNGGEGSEAAHPNIIVIMVDDMGYSDIGSYGAPIIETPTLDRLAQDGLRFTQFYNTARCAPTRASLLTGLYPHQAGIGHMTGDDNLPGYRGDLQEHTVTIAEVLGGAGYSSYMTGKWHATPYRPENPTRKNWPLQRGFDRFFGSIIGAGSYYDPAGLVLGNEYIAPREAGEQYSNDDFYYTRAISDYSVRYIKDHVEERSDAPFFLNVWYTAPHWPLHAPEGEIEKYEDKFDLGWDRLRERRYERMTEMGVIQDEWALTERDPRVPAWDDAENKEWQARRMAAYAAQIDIVDQGVGRIVEALKQAGELDNTLLLFLSDNGASQEKFGWVENRTYADNRGIEPVGRNGHQTSLYPRVTRDGQPIQLGNAPEHMPGPRNTYQSYGRGWANASNTPFRQYKHLVHEGGIATPLIAHWPAGIDREGAFERQPGHVIDLLATFADLAGTAYPDTYEGRDILSTPGTSLVPALKGNDLRREQPLFFEHQGNRAVRDGRWKLVAKGPPGPWEPSWEPSWEPGPWELYDLQADRTETNDLSEKHPERVEEMTRQWESMARRFKAVLWPYGGEFGEASGE